MKADIITIGDEILIGQIVNTNAGYLGENLSQLGFFIRRMITVSDQEESIIIALDDSIENSDLVIITGGLGPTNDDITKKTLNRYFGGKLITHQPSLDLITHFFHQRGFRLTERNREQAQVPDVCTPLPNRIGTAPGMLFGKQGKLIFSLPGVPFEMKSLFEKEVVPRLRQNYRLPVRLFRTVLTAGLSESYTADKVKAWEASLEPELSMAYLPSPGILRIRLSISGSGTDQLNNILNKRVTELTEMLGHEHVYGFDRQSLQEVVGEQLNDNKLTLGVAESCTGGHIAHLLTLVPGSSAYFMGSVTAYSNALKTQLLQVNADDIEREGAVSRTVAEQMAKGIKLQMGVDFGVATTGIAGPGGGSEDKPIGTTWIAIATPVTVISRKFLFGDNRERNILRASVTALNMLRNAIREYAENSRKKS